MFKNPTKAGTDYSHIRLRFHAHHLIPQSKARQVCEGVCHGREWVRIGVERFVHVSTDEVYGSIDHGSFSEDSRLNPASPYSASKASSDLLALSHFETYGLPVQVTRCTNNFGPNQHDEKLIPKIIDRVSKGETIPIYGDGSNVRDWLFVHDHCSAIVKVMGQNRFGEVFNIGSGVEKTNLEIVDTILKNMGISDDLIQFVEDRPGHDWRYSLDDSKIRSLGR